jgi:hypothetical protein
VEKRGDDADDSIGDAVNADPGVMSMLKAENSSARSGAAAMRLRFVARAIAPKFPSNSTFFRQDF